MSTFSKLGLAKTWGKSLFKQGISEPTPIQQEVIPAFLEKQNIFAQAQTGSGKTLAFLLPMLQLIDRDNKDAQALVVTPTRELALQISNEISKLTENISEIQSLAVYGGQDVAQQVKKSKQGAQFIVATPGRLLDHIRRGTIDLSSVSMFVLDEADEMLRMGFLPEVHQILDALPEQIQTGLFSATLNEDVRKLATSFMKDPSDIRIAPKQKVVKTIKHHMVETTDRGKFEDLCKIIEEERPFMAILFCRTKLRAMKLAGLLKRKNYIVDELHGDLSQAKRERVMRDFRNTKIQYLVATDVAARGVDVEGVTHVFNYDIPQDVESYIHRIGRTGRAGEEGVAITLFTPKDKNIVKMIQEEVDVKIVSSQ